MSQTLSNKFKQFFWFIPFLVFFSTYILLYLWFKPEAITMPNIVGTNLIQATKICSSMHICPQIVHIHIDKDLPQATITHQTPSAGSMIKKEQTIYIGITEKPALKKAPDCTGMSRQEIKKMLSAHDIRVKFHPIEYTYLSDHCFCQWPSPHAPLKTKTIICYVAQKPRKMVIWPDLKDQRLREVKLKLEEYGIEMKTNIEPNPKEQYIITDQQPKPGSIIDFTHPEDITTHVHIMPGKATRSH